MSYSKKNEVESTENHEDVLKAMTKEGGVRGWIVVNWEGIPVKYQGYTDSEAVSYAGVVMAFVDKTNIFLNQAFVHDIIPETNAALNTIQLRTPKNELIIAPHPKFILICVYDPSYVEPEKEEGDDEDDFI
mmetsp:Transcript_3469/g.6096  ORF Transcript_3469/g.6096 Transcript_3469/m.6096 type:complete len:131 (+) Transcript_3469:76-468(+)|eukprot:CAMPEP_0202687578 /NCGR_PEP_ID=MMETSP1385-20130828/3245_1 /ASSEMBLY_ACC=CAM_ASM_000861 /TAXON_ID=933848 /ORGANISM="Elphidium margaritaceum" /LENGTH=130 /DNA_ID=CAMNT_0049342399 /DNA_START=76 /DNA_END=468 /DNA_ORIENTATION=-